MNHLVIIGNGITGITTARHVRKRSNKKITVISNETDHFYSRPALMYIYMGHLRYEQTKPYENWFWEKNGIELARGRVTAVDTDHKTLHLEEGKRIGYDQLLIATGSKSNKFGWPGQDLPGVQGLYSMQDLELMEKNTSHRVSRAVMVGGGLIGVEMAEMLLSRKIPVTFLVRENYYWDNILPQQEAKLIGRHLAAHGVDLRLQTGLKEIVAGENGRVAAVVTNQGEKIDCQFVGLTPGVHPNLDAVKNSKIETGKGVLVNDYLETNIPNVYAAGDCAELRAAAGEKNRIEQLWYTGGMQALALAKTLCGERTKYERGVWFNSAKFFDVEYQTYGFVSNAPRPGEKSFYWEHPAGKHCVHIVYKEGSEEIVGVNLLGIRMRHEVWDWWIREKRTIDEVMENLRAASFDPEFYKTFEVDILSAYRRQNPHKNLRLKRQPELLKKFWKGFANGTRPNPATLNARV